ncbi:adenylate/guanylate cyclase domain-containing protein [uncultured Sulfitobacter sp.]|uniref:AAA family ATPase n=1 Tax=uncultured Sulfitobacter sp. TaxID=191468 RepID=UPI002616A486|nr:adenylate/guanylate cyclase domain-containing protein [uncultured Sulfitobacter sp.]
MTEMCATCLHCAAPLAKAAKFCSACGARVEEKRSIHSHYMTVLFCDLAGSTELTRQLGDEMMFDLISRYQEICNDAVTDHGGYVAKYMGDGMLAYFGYPEPVKNSANAAVSAGLRIIERNRDLIVPNGEISASAGTATGWMVVGDTNTGAAAAETMAIGGTVNLAARLQSEAGTGRIAVSSETGQRLDPTQFALTPLGSRNLRGFADPVRVWLVDAAISGERVTAFVGRDPMRNALRDVWTEVQKGQVLSAVIEGQGGFGKTSLAESFLESSVGEGNAFIIRAQRHRREKSFAAFRPFILSLADASVNAPRDSQKAALTAWAPPDALAGLVVLCNLNDEPVSPQLRAPMIKNALLQVLKERVPSTPATLLLDDAHWLDADSLQLIGGLPDVLRGRSLLILATRRPEGAAFPLTDARLIKLGQMDVSEMDGVISALDTDGVIDRVTRSQIVERADGVPLYVEHITRAVLERPDSRPGDTIPTTMIEALLERFTNLGDTRDLVEAAAVLGSAVRVDVLAAMLNSSEAQVYEQIGRLIARGLLRPGEHGAVSFDHALIREAVIDTLMAAHMHKLHKSALEAYETVAPGVLSVSPITAAYHLKGAGRISEAMPKLIEAAQLALARGEIAEAVRLLARAEENLDQVPTADGLRDRLEMMMRFSLGLALVQHRGFSDASVAEAYGRALELCLSGDRNGETEFQIAWGIWAHYMVIGEIDRAIRLSRRMDEIATVEPSLEVLAAAARSLVLWNTGDLAAQEAATAETRRLYVPELHRLHAVTYSMDSLEISHLFRIHTRYIAGDLPNWQAARAAAREHEDFLNLPFLRPYIRIYGAAPLTYAHSDEDYRAVIAEATEYAAEIGQPFWIVAGQIWLAHEAVRNADPESGTAALEAATDQTRAIGLHMGQAYHMATLARCFAQTGRPQDAQDAINEALSENQVGRDLIYAPEVLRLQAEVTILTDPEARGPANALLDRAQARAERTGSRAWAALIAASRARLMSVETGTPEAQAWLEKTLCALHLPGSELHPAFVTARRAFIAPI